MTILIRNTRLPTLNLQMVLSELVTTEFSQQLLPLRTDAEKNVAYEKISVFLRNALHTCIPDYIDRLSVALDQQNMTEGRSYGLMDWKQLKSLSNKGFEIGGHTATHCNVTGLDETLLRSEILSSTAEIERQLEAPVLTFAYPYGSYTADDNVMAKILQEVNCQAAFTCQRKVIEGQNRIFELPRTRLNRAYSFACGYNISESLNK